MTEETCRITRLIKELTWCLFGIEAACAVSAIWVIADSLKIIVQQTYRNCIDTGSKSIY